MAALIFLGLLLGHALADGPLQAIKVGDLKGDGGWRSVLGYALHGATHGGFVWLITGMWFLGAAEALMHVTIDLVKRTGLYRTMGDQALHVVCKVVWVLIWAMFQ